MRASPTAIELNVERGDFSLAGTLWMPAEPLATLLMHPGSGPSDRDNDVFFPPIREHLLASRIAVCSFDKRGVGGSTGRWQDAAIVEQADDLLACVSVLATDEELATPVGVFGHSQGGWVVLEAVSRDSPIAFAVTSSGPGVTPAEQERYATVTAFERSGGPPEQAELALRGFELVLGALRDRLSLEAARRLVSADVAAPYDELGVSLLPDEPALWELFAALIDFDPRPALERVRVPLLALFGQDDAVVPVNESVKVFREAVREELLTVEVFPGANHRVQAGDPPRLADGYLEALAGFVTAASAPIGAA